MEAPLLWKAGNREVGWKNALRGAELPAAHALIAGKWLPVSLEIPEPDATRYQNLMRQNFQIDQKSCDQIHSTP
jgi:hypothetical protein